MKLKFMGLLIIAAMIGCTGCKTSQATKATDAAKPDATRTVMIGTRTLTVTGAVIVKYDSDAFYYKKQCLECGYVAEKQIGSTISNGASTINSDFTCPKCANKQTVKIVVN